MGAEAFALSVWFEKVADCSECGAPCVLSQGHARAARDTGKSWYCPNGHCQVFKETELQRTQKRLAATEAAKVASDAALKHEREMHESTQRSRDAYKGKMTEMKNRVGNGVCPCCNRTFQNLLGHMKTKHPKFKLPELDVGAKSKAGA